MIDANALAKPILDLLASFGSGVLPPGGPGDALRATSTAIDQVHELGRTGINQMNTSWDGDGADAATSKALRAQTTAASISDRGNDMSVVLGKAAAEVETGQKDLTRIAQSFIDTATTAAPTLATPAGMTMIVGSAIDHLGQALKVVGRVQNELQTHTASMNELAPPPPTPPPATDPAATAATNPAASAVSALGGPQGLSQLASGVTSNAGEMVSSATSPAAAVTPSLPGGPDSPETGAGAGKDTGEGVEVTLPDGSVVEAPNEKAATAVRSATGTLGTPYVWGGNDPGSGLDCSGMTKYAYGEAGVELPRLAHEQANGATEVSPGDLAPGDLAVWDGHVAMVAGNGQLIEAGDPVQMSSIRTENSGMEFHGFYRPTE